jgi:hypothetical protein
MFDFPRWRLIGRGGANLNAAKYELDAQATRRTTGRRRGWATPPLPV